MKQTGFWKIIIDFDLSFQEIYEIWCIRCFFISLNNIFCTFQSKVIRMTPEGSTGGRNHIAPLNCYRQGRFRAIDFFKMKNYLLVKLYSLKHFRKGPSISSSGDNLTIFTHFLKTINKISGNKGQRILCFRDKKHWIFLLHFLQNINWVFFLIILTVLCTFHFSITTYFSSLHQFCLSKNKKMNKKHVYNFFPLKNK